MTLLLVLVLTNSLLSRFQSDRLETDLRTRMMYHQVVKRRYRVMVR